MSRARRWALAVAMVPVLLGGLFLLLIVAAGMALAWLARERHP